MNTKTKLIIGSVVAGVVLFACLPCCVVSLIIGKRDKDKPQDKTTDAIVKAKEPTKPEPKKETPTGFGQAHEIYNHYLQNEVGATARYGGKLLVIAGDVWQVEQSLGKTYVILACADTSSAPQPFLNTKGAYAYFDDAKEVADLQRNQKIYFTGRCDGLSLGTVVFRGCKLVPPEVMQKAMQKNPTK